MVLHHILSFLRVDVDELQASSENKKRYIHDHVFG